jgi:hypothetical protein
LTTNTAPQRQCKSVTEDRNVAISFVGKLDSGELLTGTPTVVEVTTSDLTITNVAVNTAALTVNGKAVAIGQAIQCQITGGVAGTTYTVRATGASDATPAQTLIGNVILEVIAD